MPAKEQAANRRLNALCKQVAPEACVGPAAVGGIVALAGAAGLGAHVAQQWKKHGLQTAWNKSIARKGSFTKGWRQLYSGLWHFWSIWDQRKFEKTPGVTKEEVTARVADLHGRYFEKTGDINKPEVKAKHTAARLKKQADQAMATPIMEDGSGALPERLITVEELAKHNGPESPWISLNGSVYDMSEWTEKHPGGSSVIMKYAGKDCSKVFSAVGHSEVAWKIAGGYAIGKLANAP